MGWGPWHMETLRVGCRDASVGRWPVGTHQWGAVVRQWGPVPVSDGGRAWSGPRRVGKGMGWSRRVGHMGGEGQGACLGVRTWAWRVRHVGGKCDALGGHGARWVYSCHIGCTALNVFSELPTSTRVLQSHCGLNDRASF